MPANQSRSSKAKTKSNASFALAKDENVTQLNATQALDSFMSQYAGAVITDRALPQIDGLKPVQRRLLFTMWQKGLIHGKSTKLNNIGGYTMLLHPHGDASAFVYTLAAGWENNVPLAKVIGNGGTINTGTDGGAAPRYTSATLTDAAEHVLSGLKEDAVEMVPSYDGERTEPTLLPIEFPNAFLNDVQGIAVGMRTRIIPHNPKEMIDGLLFFIDHLHTSPKRLAQIIKGPDFPTGGLLVDADDANLNELTYGHSVKGHPDKYTIRGEAKLHETKQQSEIQFISIPYGVLLEDVVQSLMAFQTKHDDLGIKEVLDSSSDYDAINIQITFKKGTSKDKLKQILSLIYQETLMQNTISPINMMIANGYPQTMSITAYFKAWLKFRIKCLQRQFTYEQNHAKIRQEIVHGLLRLIDIADDVVKDAKASTNRKVFEQILVKKYQFTARQASAIAGMALYRLGKQDVNALTKEDQQLTKQLARLEKLLSDHHALLLEIKRQLRHLNNTIFKNATRRTKLVANDPLPDVNQASLASLVKKQPAVVVAKSTGVIQRMSPQVYENNINDADQSTIVATLQSNTQQGAMFFTKNGLAYVRMVKDLENANVKTDPESVQRLIPEYKADDETIGATSFDLPLASNPQILVVATALGRVKLVNLTKVMPSTSTKRYLKHMQKYFGLRDANDYVVFVKPVSVPKPTQKDADLTLPKGYQLTLHRTKGRGAKTKTIDLAKLSVQAGSGAGSHLWKIADDDHVQNVELIEPQTESNDSNSSTDPKEKKG